MMGSFDDSKELADKLVEIRDYRTEYDDDKYYLTECAEHIDSMYNYMRSLERKLIKLQDKLIKQTIKHKGN